MTDNTGNPNEGSYPENEDAFREFMDGPRDVFICESCGSKAYRALRGGKPGAFYAEVDGEPTVVCYECDDNYEWGIIEERIRDRRLAAQRSFIGTWIVHVRAAIRPIVSRIPAPLSVQGVDPDRRSSLVSEHSVFVGRIGTFVGFAAIFLAGIAIFAAVTGAVFVSLATGAEWFASTLVLYRAGGEFLVAHPALALGVLGFGYLVHLLEYQQYIEVQEFNLGRARPRWHYLTFFAVSGLVGGFVWILSQLDIFAPIFLPTGVLIWSASTFVLVYFLHYTLLEDRWSYGLRVQPALWKFPTQYALGLKLYDGVIGLPGSTLVSYTVTIIPPMVGLLYATRRYLAFTEQWARISRWFQQVAHRWRQALPAIPRSGLHRRSKTPVTNQFEQIIEHSTDETTSGDQATDARDPNQELRQAHEWADYLESELHDREEQLQDLEAKLARVRQDLREARQGTSEMDDAATQERNELLADLFDIRDNFRRAVDVEATLGDEAASNLREGFELIDRQIKAVLEREGVEGIDTSGTADPDKHKIVETVESANHDPGEIVDVYRLGYRQDDRILREAHVVVAEEPTDSDGGETAKNGGRNNSTDSGREDYFNQGGSPP